MGKKKKLSKTYKKLGFTYLETAEIVVALNKLLANYIIHYHKLRNFHWNVEGADFFELHEQFEIEYNEVKLHIDIIAERIRVFGIKPKYTLQKFLKLSDINEVEGDLTSVQMVKEVLKDFGFLHKAMLDVTHASLETGDTATEEMVTGFIRRLEKRNWMFTAFIKS